MEIIGVTGSSGSGKSVFAKRMELMTEAKLINVDSLVKEIQTPGSEYMNKIAEIFGKDVFLDDGNLDRKKLSGKLFNESEKREALNKVTFETVGREIGELIIKYQNDDEEMLIIDAPLLIEAKITTFCDDVIVVEAEEEIKIKRICERDGISLKEAAKRLEAQHLDAFYEPSADFIVENNGSLQEMYSKVDDVLNRIKEHNYESKRI